MKKLFLLAFALALAACATVVPRRRSRPRPPPGRRSIRSACPTGRAQLAADDFQGRAPGTEGETRTIAWLTEQFRALGLEPGGENGGWTQRVPLIRTQVPEPGELHHRQPRRDADAAIAARPLCRHRPRDRPGPDRQRADGLRRLRRHRARARLGRFRRRRPARQDRRLPGQRSRFRGGAGRAGRRAGSAAGR